MSRFSRAVVVAASLAAAAGAAEPVEHVWIRSRMPASAGPFRPEVHSVEVRPAEVVVRSAGLSISYLGPLQSTPAGPGKARQFEFRIPRNPRAAAGHSELPAEVIGAFANGVPIYNLFERGSYEDRGLWRYDPVGANRELSPLLVKVIEGNGKHSPILGYALDGFPIYGPWGLVNGSLRRMRSSYRLREMAGRTQLPGGEPLTPAQYGPAIDELAPSGTFAEDYEFVRGSGALDEFNGRFAVTPEYPQGTYAYFLSTGDGGRLSFPYLIGPRYYGTIAARASDPDVTAVFSEGRFTVKAKEVKAGTPARLAFRLGRLEIAHEKPVHLIVVSDDLAVFDHIHPEPRGDGWYEVEHTFSSGGRYRLYADFIAAGSTPRVERLELTVEGRPRPQVALRETAAEGATLIADKPLLAGSEIGFEFKLNDPEGHERYLGAWAHFVILSEDPRTFIHAHPLEDAPESSSHAHAPGPAPASVRTIVNFPQPGVYKIWAQVQRNGRVDTLPYVVRVGGDVAEGKHAVPPDTVRVLVSGSGYVPARIEAAAGRVLKLAFERDRTPNCGGRVIFPDLKLVRDLPAGEVTVVEVEVPAAGELRFTCGMGMYKGLIVAR